MTQGFLGVDIIGNVGGDATLNHSASGTPVLNFSVAINRSTKKNGEFVDEPPIWTRVTLWGNQATNYQDKIKRGSLILVKGELFPGKFTGRDGLVKDVYDVKNVSTIRVFPKGESTGARDGGEYAARPASAPAGQASSAPAEDLGFDDGQEF